MPAWDGTLSAGGRSNEKILSILPNWVGQGGFPDATQRLLLPKPVKRLINQWRRLELVETVVWQKVQDLLTLETLKQVVVPVSKTHALLEACQKHAGHPGTDWMKFYWPHMEQAVQVVGQEVAITTTETQLT